MWSCRHLMDDFLSDGNIKLAIMNASKGKRSRASVRPLVQDPDAWIPVIRDYTLHFRNSRHVPKTINDNGHGKQRTIIVPVFAASDKACQAHEKHREQRQKIHVVSGLVFAHGHIQRIQEVGQAISGYQKTENQDRKI